MYSNSSYPDINSQRIPMVVDDQRIPSMSYCLVLQFVISKMLIEVVNIVRDLKTLLSKEGNTTIRKRRRDGPNEYE